MAAAIWQQGDALSAPKLQAGTASQGAGFPAASLTLLELKGMHHRTPVLPCSPSPDMSGGLQVCQAGSPKPLWRAGWGCCSRQSCWRPELALTPQMPAFSCNCFHPALAACRMRLLASRPGQPRAPKCAQGSSTMCQVPSGASSPLRPATRAVREAAALLSKRYVAAAVAEWAAVAAEL